eukprot:882914-Pelagomonas_calceolata.AAC.1
MLDDNVSPAADQPDSRAVGQPLVTLVSVGGLYGAMDSQGDAPFLQYHTQQIRLRLHAVSPGNALVCCASTRLDILGSGKDLTHWQQSNSSSMLRPLKLARGAGRARARVPGGGHWLRSGPR